MIGLLPLTNGKETAILLPLWTTSASGQKQLPFLTRRQLEWLCFFMSCMSMILSHINIHFNIAKLPSDLAVVKSSSQTKGASL